MPRRCLSPHCVPSPFRLDVSAGVHSLCASKSQNNSSLGWNTLFPTHMSRRRMISLLAVSPAKPRAGLPSKAYVPVPDPDSLQKNGPLPGFAKQSVRSCSRPVSCPKEWSASWAFRAKRTARFPAWITHENGTLYRFVTAGAVAKQAFSQISFQKDRADNPFNGNPLDFSAQMSVLVFNPYFTTATSIVPFKVKKSRQDPSDIAPQPPS